VVAVATSLAGSFNSWAKNPVQIETTQVRDNIYLLTGQVGNTGLFIGPDGSRTYLSLETSY